MDQKQAELYLKQTLGESVYEDCWDEVLGHLDSGKFNAAAWEAAGEDMDLFTTLCYTESVFTANVQKTLKCASHREWVRKALHILGGVEGVKNNPVWRAWQGRFVEDLQAWARWRQAEAERQFKHVDGRADMDRALKLFNGFGSLGTTPALGEDGKPTAEMVEDETTRWLRHAFIPAFPGAGKTMSMVMMSVFWPYEELNRDLDMGEAKDVMKTSDRFLHLCPECAHVTNFFKTGVHSEMSDAELKKSCYCAVFGLPLYLVRDLASHIIKLDDPDYVKDNTMRQRLMRAWQIVATHGACASALAHDLKHPEQSRAIGDEASFAVISNDEGDVGSRVVRPEGAGKDEDLEQIKDWLDGRCRKPLKLNDKETGWRNIQFACRRANILMWSGTRLDFHKEIREIGGCRYVELLERREACAIMLKVMNPTGYFNPGTGEEIKGPQFGGVHGAWPDSEYEYLVDDYRVLVAEAIQGVYEALHQRSRHHLPMQVLVLAPIRGEDSASGKGGRFRDIEMLAQHIQHQVDLNSITCPLTGRTLRVEFVSSHKTDVTPYNAHKNRTNENSSTRMVVSNDESFRRMDTLESDILVMCQTCKRGWSDNFCNVGVNLFVYNDSMWNQAGQIQGAARTIRPIAYDGINKCHNQAQLDVLSRFSRRWMCDQECAECIPKFEEAFGKASGRIPRHSMMKKLYPVGEQFEMELCRTCKAKADVAFQGFKDAVETYAADPTHPTGLKLQTSVIFEKGVLATPNVENMRKVLESEGILPKQLEEEEVLLQNPQMHAPVPKVQMEARAPVAVAEEVGGFSEEQKQRAQAVVAGAVQGSQEEPELSEEERFAKEQEAEDERERLEAEHVKAVQKQQRGLAMRFKNHSEIRITAEKPGKDRKHVVTIQVSNLFPDSTVFVVHSDNADVNSTDAQGKSTYTLVKGTETRIPAELPNGKFSWTVRLCDLKVKRGNCFFRAVVQLKGRSEPAPDHAGFFKKTSNFGFHITGQAGTLDVDGRLHQLDEERSKPGAKSRGLGGGGGAAKSDNAPKKNKVPQHRSVMELSMLCPDKEAEGGAIADLFKCLLYEQFGEWPENVNHGKLAAWQSMPNHAWTHLSAAMKTAMETNGAFHALAGLCHKDKSRQTTMHYKECLSYASALKHQFDLMIKRQSVPFHRKNVALEDADEIASQSSTALGVSYDSQKRMGLVPLSDKDEDGDYVMPEMGVLDKLPKPAPPPPPQPKSCKRKAEASESEAEMDGDFVDSDNESMHSGPSDEGRGPRHNETWAGLCNVFDDLKDLVETRLRKWLQDNYVPKKQKADPNATPQKIEDNRQYRINRIVNNCRHGVVTRFHCAHYEPEDAKKPATLRDIFDPDVTDWGSGGTLASLIIEKSLCGKKEGKGGGNSNTDFNEAFDKVWKNLLN